MSLYSDRIAKGLCGGCGKESVEAGVSLGPICKEKSRLRSEAKRKKNRADGGCVDCGKPVVSGTRCPEHAARSAKDQKRRVLGRKAKGLCAGCGKCEPKADCVLCQTCIDKGSRISSEHYHRRKREGLCRFCNSLPIEGQVLCEHHRETYKDYRDQLKIEVFEAYGGLTCVSCGNDEFAVLEIDHIAGDGAKHRRELSMSSGTQFYMWLRKNGYPPGFRVLCPTCNKKAHRGLLK